MQNRTFNLPVFKLWGIITFIVIFVFACGLGAKKGDKIVARVGDKYLYFSEMSNIFPRECSKEDSTLLAKLYIDNWIKTKLLLKKAELNLLKEQFDISKEIETYRTSLLIYKYQVQMLREKLDTIVHESEIKSYYDANMVNFPSDEYVVKAVYIILPATAPNLWNVRRLCTSKQEKDMQDLIDYCRNHAVYFDFFDDEWIPWAEIDLPQKEAATKLISNSDRIEQQNGELIYLVGVKDKKAPGDTAPFELVKDKVKSIIINKRKLKFISELEQDIYNDALSKKQFEIYKNP